MKFLVKQTGDLLHGVAVRRRWLEREIFPIPLQRERAVVQILVRYDGEIQQCGGVTRLLMQRRLELLRRLLIATPLNLHQAESIPGLWQMRVEFQSLAKTFLPRIGLAGAQMRGSQFDPAAGSVGLKTGVTGQLQDGGWQVALIEVKAAEIEMTDGEIAVQRQGLLISPDRVAEPAGAVISQAKVVPGTGLFGQQVRRLFQPLNRLGIVAFVNETFALQQRAWAKLPAPA